MTNFLKNLNIRWKRASRNRNYLINRNKHWLATKVYQSPLDETSAKELINTTPPTPHLAKALSQVNTESPSTSSCNTECSFSPIEALSLILDCSLSKRSYQNLRSKTLKKNSNIFPSYNNVCIAKEECLPSPPEEWHTTNDSAEVTLQDLLDHTTRRIF